MLGYIKNKLFPSYKMTEKEQLTYDIIRMLCEQADTDLKLIPSTGNYLMVNKRLAYWAKVEQFSVSITNHKFTLSTIINNEYQKLLSKLVNDFVESNVSEFEETVLQNEVELLESIKVNIKFNN